MITICHIILLLQILCSCSLHVSQETRSRQGCMPTSGAMPQLGWWLSCSRQILLLSAPGGQESAPKAIASSSSLASESLELCTAGEAVEPISKAPGDQQMRMLPHARGRALGQPSQLPSLPARTVPLAQSASLQQDRQCSQRVPTLALSAPQQPALLQAELAPAHAHQVLGLFLRSLSYVKWRISIHTSHCCHH